MGGPDANIDGGKQPISVVRASGGFPGNVSQQIKQNNKQTVLKYHSEIIW